MPTKAERDNTDAHLDWLLIYSQSSAKAYAMVPPVFRVACLLQVPGNSISMTRTARAHQLISKMCERLCVMFRPSCHSVVLSVISLRSLAQALEINPSSQEQACSCLTAEQRPFLPTYRSLSRNLLVDPHFHPIVQMETANVVNL